MQCLESIIPKYNENLVQFWPKREHRLAQEATGSYQTFKVKRTPGQESEVPALAFPGHHPASTQGDVPRNISKVIHVVFQIFCSSRREIKGKLGWL